MHRRAPHAEMAEHRGTERRIEFDRQPDRRATAGNDHRVDEVELCDVVDHQRHAGRQLRISGEACDRSTVDARVPDDDVVMRPAVG